MLAQCALLHDTSSPRRWDRSGAVMRCMYGLWIYSLLLIAVLLTVLSSKSLTSLASPHSSVRADEILHGSHRQATCILLPGAHGAVPQQGEHDDHGHAVRGRVHKCGPPIASTRRGDAGAHL